MNSPIQSTGNPVRKGFLRDFVEKSVDLPPDGRNGECFVHFERFAYTMNVQMVNGKREGMAIIRGGKYSSCTKVEYRNGELSGIVEQCCYDGTLQLRGHLVNGIETGLFTEYDHYGNVVWRGYYRNGEAYSEVLKSKTMKGFYEERDMISNELLSIAQYDDALQDKNGRCLEYENGRWTGESVYENGMKKRMVREYRNDSITFYDENGEKTKMMKCSELPEGVQITGMRAYNLMTSILNEEEITSFSVYDVDSGDNYGVCEFGSNYYAMKWSEEENYVMEGNWKRHETRYCEDDKWEEIPNEVHGIDLNTNGKRWEGSVRNGKPFGYGILYNEEGRKEYEGFMMNGMKSCFGREYFDDIEKVKYEGSYFEDKRYGYGVEYDRNGDIFQDDMWRNDVSYMEPDDRTIQSISEDCIRISAHNEVNFFTFPFWFHFVKYILIDD